MEEAEEEAGEAITIEEIDAATGEVKPAEEEPIEEPIEESKEETKDFDLEDIEPAEEELEELESGLIEGEDA